VATAQAGRELSVRFVDQMGEGVELAGRPERIVSLVPSQTELLFHLGVGDRVVGVTRYCTDPALELSTVTRIGGTKKFNFSTIDTLAPDLILGNKEENYPDGIERLKQAYPVWMSDIYTLDDALAMIECVAVMVDAEERGAALCRQIRERFAALEDAPAPVPAAYFIWRKPYMVVGGHNFVDHLLTRAGFTNVFGVQERYPEVSAAAIGAAAPEVVLLSSEPFPFTAAHVDEFRALAPDAEVLLVDGTMFSWYGSRLTQIPAYFESLRRTLAERRRGAA
jgi:ABC-type Fe3+-hydroxamate transport system substrate-binding protein